MIFHEKNIGRQVRLVEDLALGEISYILKDRKRFRIKSEENGPIVSDYDFKDLAEADCLTISNDDGKTWQDSAIRYNVQESAKEAKAVKTQKDKEAKEK